MVTIILIVTFLAAIGLMSVLGLAIRTVRNLADPKPGRLINIQGETQ